jgi:UPF0755 protein
MKNPIVRALVRTWITGALFLLAGIGYTFYGILWIYRFMGMFATKTIIAATVLMIVFCAAAWYFLFPLRSSGSPIELTITKGTTIHAVGRTLKMRGVVTSSTAFVIWVKLSGAEKKLQAGRVSLFAGQGAVEAVKKLMHAEPIELTVTLPEGLTVWQVAGALSRALSIDSADFVRICRDTAAARGLGVPGLSLEGYLFPDTYRFPPGIAPILVAKQMVEHFNEKYANAFFGQEGQSALRKNEAIVLASIIEKEATLASERPLISGVFHNRLKKNMPLGADPTTRYFLNKLNGPLHVSELAVNSPYNTRIHAGLPPGPICSPGLASIKAALFPARTNMLYFVARWDGSGSHDFSLTNEEHSKKKNAIRAGIERKKTTAVRVKK